MGGGNSMTRLEVITNYARDCIAHPETNCRKHRWACQRLLDDIKKMGTDPDYPYYWDEAEAEKIVRWFSMLRHHEGVLSQQPIILTEWQQFRLCQLYGWRKKNNGRRRFRKYFIEVGRKNAKTQEEAGVALYEMSVTATKNGEVAQCYSAGPKREQSKYVFQEATHMLKGSPLAPKFCVNKTEIRHIKTGSFLKPLSKEDGKTGDGSNPALLVIDEYHQHPNTDLYDLNIGSNTKEPLLMIITTAGRDLTFPCYTQEYKYCSDLLDPNKTEIVNDEYFTDILELDPEDYENLSDLSDESKWMKANPIRMSYPDGREKIRSDYVLAKSIPEKWPGFLTKALNIWVQAKENGYMDMSKFRKCEVADLTLEDMKGMSVYVGFDLSAKIDLTSVSFVFPVQAEDEFDEDGKPIIKYIIFCHSFIPTREKLMEHVVKDRAPYDAWELQGYITITDTSIVNQSAVMHYVMETVSQYDLHIEQLCFDPANASKLMMDLSDEGYDCVEVYQSHKSLNEATQGFREQVYAGNVIYQKNPVLTYAMSNAVVRTNQGLIKIDKDANNKRIDPVDATLAAFKLALYHDFSPDTTLDDIDAYLKAGGY